MERPHWPSPSLRQPRLHDLPRGHPTHQAAVFLLEQARVKHLLHQGLGLLGQQVGGAVGLIHLNDRNSDEPTLQLEEASERWDINYCYYYYFIITDEHCAYHKLHVRGYKTMNTIKNIYKLYLSCCLRVWIHTHFCSYQEACTVIRILSTYLIIN